MTRKALALAASCVVLAGCGLSIGTGLRAGSGENPDPDALIPIFPPDNPWNADIPGYPVHPNSGRFIAEIGAGLGLHPDFGTEWEGAPNGIPFAVVGKGQRKAPVDFVSWPEESDPGPYPIPDDAPIEGGPDSDGDRHVLVIDRDARALYEIGGAEHPDYPPMGLRLRLRADFDLTPFSKANKAILQAMKTYGMIVADNGSDWFVSGAPDPRWDDEDLAELSSVRGSDFEVVYTGEIIVP